MARGYKPRPGARQDVLNAYWFVQPSLASTTPALKMINVNAGALDKLGVSTRTTDPVVRFYGLVIPDKHQIRLYAPGEVLPISNLLISSNPALTAVTPNGVNRTVRRKYFFKSDVLYHMPLGRYINVGDRLYEYEELTDGGLKSSIDSTIKE